MLGLRQRMKLAPVAFSLVIRSFSWVWVLTGQTSRQADGQTGRQADGQMGRQVDGQTDTQQWYLHTQHNGWLTRITLFCSCNGSHMSYARTSTCTCTSPHTPHLLLKVLTHYHPHLTSPHSTLIPPNPSTPLHPTPHPSPHLTPPSSYPTPQPHSTPPLTSPHSTLIPPNPTTPLHYHPHLTPPLTPTSSHPSSHPTPHPHSTPPLTLNLLPTLMRVSFLLPGTPCPTLSGNSDLTNGCWL